MSTSGEDAMQVGSGTKMYTAAAVMRLVDQGKIKLTDRLQKHVDAPLAAMWNTSLVGMFGAIASNITVNNLMRMNSGLGDFDTIFDNNTFDADALANGTRRPDVIHSPLESLAFVANLPLLPNFSNCRNVPGTHWKPATSIRNCRFVCEPGTCFQYSTAGYMLAGLMLLKHAPPGQQTWQTFDHFDALGLDASEFGSLRFPTHGAMHKVGLSVCGDAGIYNNTAIWAQDQSIMSWTGGYCIASAHNMAKFLFKLVVPGHMSIVSPKSVAIMQNVSQMNRMRRCEKVREGARRCEKE